MLVLVTWVFFRAATLADALRYLGCMLGLVEISPGAELLAADVYSVFPVELLLVAGAITWWGRRTCDWVSAPRLSLHLVLLTVGLFLLSLLEMSVQSHNPFLYFQF